MSRRDQIRMTDDERRAFIDAAPTIILNSIGKDGVPHPMPMWFALGDDESILMTTFSKSQKILNLRRDPRVSLLLESGSEYAELRGVVIYGTVELLTDVDEVSGILAKVGIRQSPDVAKGSDVEALQEGLRRSALKRTGIRVKPERIVSWDHGKLGGIY